MQRLEGKLPAAVWSRSVTDAPCGTAVDPGETTAQDAAEGENGRAQ
jgi:hypothetical protein